jgi:tetratricopeptide (TPR) repeat protein
MRIGRVISRACICAALGLAGAAAAFAATAEPPDGAAIDAALRNYRKTHYRAAFRLFVDASRANPKEDLAKFVAYAIATMKGLDGQYKDLERAEAAFRRSDGKVSPGELFLKHYLMAHTIMQKPFYIALVEPHLKRAIELNGGLAQIHFDLGNAYYASMRYDKAAASYEKAIGIDPSDARFYKMAGDACVAVGDFDKARRFYSDLIEKNEKLKTRLRPEEVAEARTVMNVLPETYKDIDLLLKAERFDEAEEILKKRVSLNSADYIALTALGNLYLHKGDRRTAKRFLDDAIRIAPDYPIAHLVMGRLRYLMRENDKALEELGRFHDGMRRLPKMDDETKSSYIDELYYMSQLYFEMQKYDDARAGIEEIIRLDPKEQDAYYALGVYHYKHGHDRPQAYKNFRKAAEMDPGSATAKRAAYAIEFMRNNPDSRVVPDFSFIDREYRD